MQSLDKIVSIPYFFPISSFPLEHPQDVVFPLRKLFPKTIISLPHSHLHFHLARPSLEGAYAITVNLPYLLPISLIVFIL